MKNFHRLVIVVGMFSIMAVVWAAWSILLMPSPTAFVVLSDEPITLFADFSGGGSLDVGTAAGNITDELVIRNNDGIVRINISVDEAHLDDILDTCTDWADDCVISYQVNNTNINPPETYDLPMGDSKIKITLSCDRFSCPQEHHVNLTIVGA